MEKDIVLPIGKWDFESLRDSKAIYVDKTEHIGSAISSGADVMLFTRPRRFGKSLFLTTLYSFFDIRKESLKYFEDLKIMKDQNAISWMNKYPVIYLSLQNIYSDTFESAYENLELLISSLFQSFSFLLEDELYSEQREMFFSLRQRKAQKSDLTHSLLFLSELLYQHYQKKVIILIDEYDVHLAKADSAEYYPQMIGVIRELFTSTLKGNQYLEKAFLTGCLRISKESIFTGLNNLKTYSLTDAAFSSAFGFTEKEVQNLLEQAGIEDKAEIIKAWYDGYRIGKDKIYCPWDVTQYITDLIADHEKEPDNYWANTSENSAITKLVEVSCFQVEEEYKTLVNGGSIYKKIKNDLTYGNLYKSEENLWSLLFQTGYLTLKDRFNPTGETEMLIPNEEVKNTFLTTVESWSKEQSSSDSHAEFCQAMWLKDVDKLTEIIMGHLRSTISFYDYDETFYHGFILGFFFGTSYVVKSNRETGDGRADISIIDLEKKRVAIIEIKRSERIENLAKDAIKAIKQAKEKRYEDEFEGFSVILYGMAFYKKYLMIEKDS